MSSASFSASVVTVLTMCILILSWVLTVQNIFGSWIPIFMNMLCFLFGAAATMVLSRMPSITFKYLAPRANYDRSSDIYGLDHGRLNVVLPPQTMWMNMGYWKSGHAIFADNVRQNTSDFPAACEGLLLEVLKTAKLLPEVRPISQNRKQAIRLLDLGFGCGDQIRSLLKPGIAHRGASEVAEELSWAEPLIDHYVGITLNRSQFNYAKQQLIHLDVLNDSRRVRIFCADAAQPSKWSAKLRESVAQLSAPLVDFSSSHRSLKVEDHQPAPETWVLALDTMYHFFPSREPMLEYAYWELGASSMAFDLLVSDTASLGSRFLLAILALLMRCPTNTFMTELRYRNMLKNAGYREGNIEFKDISEHVFAPLARYLDERDKSLQLLGLNIGAFCVAKWIFGWWARSGFVRGIIVIARR